jgi:predicted dehydrogenase
VARSLVIGYGSIGARHARLLEAMGNDVAVVSARDIDALKPYRTLEEGWEAHRPSYVVVANQTDRHHDTLARLAAVGYTGTVLVEKPMFDRVRPVPEHRFSEVRIAYNLRFHPVLQRLRNLLEGQRVISVHAYVGQYLPDWRPGTDYRHCYSARADQGGGALLDLSHDLDYLSWMTGAWRRVTAIGGRLGQLEITSDDTFALLLETERCPVLSVQLNYLDRLGRRRIVVNTDDHSYEADLIRQILFVDREEMTFQVERDTTYRAMHTAMLSGHAASACSLQEGMATLQLVEAARTAARNHDWIER